jgi:ornithine decarboxylase
MLFEDMGACTVAAASTFSGFQRPDIYSVMSRPMWQLMKQIESHGFPLEVEEQDDGTLPMPCARRAGWTVSLQPVLLMCRCHSCSCKFSLN